MCERIGVMQQSKGTNAILSPLSANLIAFAEPKSVYVGLMEVFNGGVHITFH